MKRLLIIQDREVTSESIVNMATDLAPLCLCDNAEWTSFVPDALSRWRGDLIIPVVLHEVARPIAFFRWLSQHSTAATILAVLPEQAEAELLQLASRVVDDFVIWPARPREVQERIRRLVGPVSGEASFVSERLSKELGVADLVGREPAFLSVLKKIPLLARSQSPVLITGETGTGKELYARAIHHLSERRHGPFVPVDCGAFPDQLFENEVFGHVRGAFTDASRDQKGLIALAEGGTLFLDEVDALSLSAQAKLLRFLQEHTYKPLGAERYAKADVKIQAATNRDMEQLVEEGKFRADLFFRLNVLRVHMPPLRERPLDIPLLARHFLDRLSDEHRLPRKTLAASTLHTLRLLPWPGNVRELFNVIQRAFALAEGAHILPEHLEQSDSLVLRKTAWGSFKQARTQAIEEFERRYLSEMLHQHHGNVTQAARAAQKERRAFGRLLKRYHIERIVLS